MKLEELVSKNYSQLNESDISIWNYIDSNKKECSKLSIEELATICNVSRTTILRFTKKLSLNGFSELKVLLKWEREKESYTPNLQKVYSCYYSLLEYMKQRDCSSMFKRIDSARNIYVFGTGAMQENIAKGLQLMFLNSYMTFYNIEGYDELDVIFDIINDEDVIFLISLSGDSAILRDAIIKLKIKNTYIVSLTRLKDNYLSQMSNESFYIPTTKLDFKNSEKDYEPMGSFFLMIEVLYLKYQEYCNS